VLLLTPIMLFIEVKVKADIESVSLPIAVNSPRKHQRTFAARRILLCMANTPVPPFSWNDNSASDFHLEQFKILRGKADKLHEETRATERYVLLASGAIYTFLFAHSDALHTLTSAKFIWWIPPVLALFGALRSYALRDYITGCDGYVKKAEDTLRLSGLVGWEHYWKDDPETRELHKTERVAGAIWGATLLGTIVVAVIAMFVY